MFAPWMICLLLLGTRTCFAEEEEELDPAEGPWGTENVAQLNQVTFQDFIQSNPSVLVAFYAPWCGHCQAFKPDFAVAADTVVAEGLGQLAAVDCDAEENDELCKLMEVEGFPTVKYFKGGNSMLYEGSRAVEDIVNFMRDPPTPSPPEPPVDWTGTDVIQLDADSFKGFLAENPSVLAMFYTPNGKFCKKMKPVFEGGAKLVNAEGKAPGKLAVVDCDAQKALCTEEGVSKVPKARYYKDGVFAHGFSGERTAEGIVTFMNNPQKPPEVVAPPPPPEPKAWKDENQDVIHLDDATFDAFLEKEPRVLTVFYAPWCGASQEAKPLIEKLAKLANVENQMGGGKVAAVDCVESKALCEKYKINSYPTGIYIKDQTEQVKYDGGATIEEVMAFAMKHALPEATFGATAEDLKDVDLKEEAKDEL